MGRPPLPIAPGDQFNKLTVISDSFTNPIRPNENRIVWCECICGDRRTYRVSDLKNNKRYSCGCENIRLMSQKEYAKNGPDNPLWRGHGEISGSFWNRTKRGAITRNYQFAISIEYAWDLFLKQNRLCAISGEPLTFALHLPIKDRGGQATASIDRINSRKGYLEGNIQWVHGNVNIMKQWFHDSVFIKWCMTIAEYQNKLELSKVA